MLVQLVQDRGLSDAGIAGHEHNLWGTFGHDPIEGREQCVNFLLAPVQLLWDQQSVRHVVRAQRKPIDPSAGFQGREAAPEIGLNARGGLITFLGHLREKLHDNRRDRLWQPLHPFTWEHRLSCDVAMDPLHRIGGREREDSCEHFVQTDTVRIKVASRINRPAHTAGLFGCHVGQCPCDLRGRFGQLAFARKRASNAETG